jgi:serine protease inhibitor
MRQRLNRPQPQNSSADTTLEVNEEGSTAAAATGVQMRPTSIMPNRGEFNLVFDRPFLVVIADRDSGTILFLGIIGDPKE